MSMQLRSISVPLFLLFTVCLSLHMASSRHDNRSPTRRFTPCCVQVTTIKNPISDKVTEYRRQPASSPCVEAIVLYTDKGQVCSSPRSSWVLKNLHGWKKRFA
ncbi:chemokine (C-C motif) ligand 34b, duplicate 4 [Polymixia lowei]